MEFEWDEAKADSNFEKHGVSFPDAIGVFEDPFERTVPAREAGGETRWQTVGRAGEIVLSVIHVLRVSPAGEFRIRLISARPASKQERSDYERK